MRPFLQLYLLVIAFATLGEVRADNLISARQISDELKPYGIHSTEFSAQKYEEPKYRWIKKEFLPFYKRYLQSSRAFYQSEGIDCDNFCVFFQSALFQQNVKSGNISKANSAVGVLYADVGRFLDVRHVLILIRTDRGWMTVEGENGRVVPLKRYIRKNRVLKAVF